MQSTRDVAPDTLSVDLLDHGVEVTYLDGRSVLYRGVPEAVTPPLRTAPGREVHVLVTDGEGREGVLLYVDDRTTEAPILEDTGVGRVTLDRGERATLFPGVAARRDAEHHVVEADPDAVDGRVFVFAEDDWAERSYELVAGDGEAADADDEGGHEGDVAGDGQGA